MKTTLVEAKALLRHLTQSSVERAEAPAKWQGKHTQRFVPDGKVQGLSLRVLDSGTRSYILQMRIKGKLRRITLGKHPGWTLAQARQRATELRAEVGHGGDPVANKKREQESKALTFGHLCERFYAHSKAKDRRSVGLIRARIEKHCSAWLDRKAAEISRAEITALHDRIAAEGRRVLAKNIIAVVKTIYFLAIKQEAFEGKNPACGIETFKAPGRERFLSSEEIERVKIELLVEDWKIQAFVLLALLTGARKSELLTARWENIDLKNCAWQKPKTKTVAQIMPLPRAAIALLESLPSRGKSEWLFPGRSKSGRLLDLFPIWDRIRNRAGVPDCRIHDLRHSFASSLVSRGVPLYTVSKLLNHSTLATTQRYAHLSLDTQRAAIEENADALRITDAAIDTTARPA